MSHSPSFTDQECLAFPQEIIEHIIDYLHTDRTTLVICSQVSHTFYWASGYHLFSEHTINWGPKTFAEVPQRNTLERFLDCIDSLPFVATWLRSLTIQPFAGFGWINIDTGNFLTVLAKLPHLRTLCLRFLKFSSINDDPLVSATASLQSRLSLAHLEVELVDFWDVETFHRVLSSFRRVDSFQILRCFNGEAEDRTFYLPDDYRPIYPATLSIGTLETQLLDDSRDVYLLRCLGSFLRTKGNTVDSAILDISARFHPLTKMQEVGKVIRDHPEIESITIDLDTAITLHKVSPGLSGE
ncbi:hypothetical protein C8Q75DRAFT_489264 [Abortiporus biennis]|nr:hypothetical protein C8Q75DRAFT_489264 [Abortiporus biennis]